MASLIAAIIGIDVHDNVFLVGKSELRDFLNAAGFEENVKAMVNATDSWSYTVAVEGETPNRHSYIKVFVTVVGENVNSSAAKTRRMFGKFFEALKDSFCYGESEVKVISLTVKKTGEKDNE